MSQKLNVLWDKCKPILIMTGIIIFFLAVIIYNYNCFTIMHLFYSWLKSLI